MVLHGMIEDLAERRVFPVRESLGSPLGIWVPSLGDRPCEPRHKPPSLFGGRFGVASNPHPLRSSGDFPVEIERP